MDLESLERRLRRVEDRAAIENLLVRYSIACDLRDYDSLANCFAEDGSFEAVAGKVTGRGALVEYYKSRFRLYGPTYHVPHGVALTFDDDNRAHGTVIAHSEIMMDDGFVVSGHYYHDSYVRGDDGEWRLQSRDNSFFYGMPLAELPTMNWREPRRRWPGAAPVPADVPEGTATWQAAQREDA